MNLKNKYANRSKISEKKLRELVRLFSLDIGATNIAELTGLNRNTVNRYLDEIRVKIAEFCEEESPVSGEVEVDESYFGPRRVRGKKGRGALGKTIVFGLFKRAGKVYTEIVPNCSKRVLQQVIRGRIDVDSVIHSDGWRGYDGLVDLGYKKHYRVHHGKNEFVRGKAHINGIESFWAFAKIRLVKFKGIHKSKFYLHLKESEFRFNHRNEDLYTKLLDLLRKNPLF